MKLIPLSVLAIAAISFFGGQAQAQSDSAGGVEQVTPKFGRAGAPKPNVSRYCELKLDLQMKGYADPISDAVASIVDSLQPSFTHLRLVTSFSRFNKKKLFEIKIEEQSQSWTALTGHGVVAQVEVLDRTGETQYVRSRSAVRAVSFRSYEHAVAKLVKKTLQKYGEDLNFAARELKCEAFE
jgi:hypothetical protein